MIGYYTTGIKFGIGRATYDAAQEIRSDINREEGVALVKKFDHEYPSRFSDEIFKYLSINKEEHPIAYKAFESQRWIENTLIDYVILLDHHIYGNMIKMVGAMK